MWMRASRALEEAPASRGRRLAAEGDEHISKSPLVLPVDLGEHPTGRRGDVVTAHVRDPRSSHNSHCQPSRSGSWMKHGENE
jgi:hypothetical protein